MFSNTLNNLKNVLFETLKRSKVLQLYQSIEKTNFKMTKTLIKIWLVVLIQPDFNTHKSTAIIIKWCCFQDTRPTIKQKHTCTGTTAFAQSKNKMVMASLGIFFPI